MKNIFSSLVAMFLWMFAGVISADARILPGMKVVPVATVQGGFLTSLAFDSKDQLFYSVLGGKILRVDGEESSVVTEITSANVGNAGLLGIVFDASDRIFAHYVTPDLTSEVLGRYDPAEGRVTVLVSLLCAPDGRPCSSEHHGGNPAVGPNGEVYFGIGDFGSGPNAQSTDSPGGKIVVLNPDGSRQIFATGFRNPFDLGFSQSTQKLIVSDNGPVGEDELHAVTLGENAGWPLTVGNQPPVPGTIPPLYVFPSTVAPTGLTLYRHRGVIPVDSVLQATFVTKGLYLFPDTTGKTLPPPIEMLAGETSPIIDVTTDSVGRIFFATGKMIYRLDLPLPGDADGNGVIDDADLQAIAHEIVDGDGSRTIDAQNGSLRSSWGADVNRDGVIDARDLVLFVRMRATPRSHGTRR